MGQEDGLARDSSFRYFPDAERMERLYCLGLPVSATGRDIVTRRGKRKMDNGTLRDEKAYEAIRTGRLPTRSAPSRHECGEASPIDVAKSHEEPAGIPEEHARVLLAAIVESSDDAIVSKTLDGVITSWNGGAERMFGWPAPMAIGKHITLIVPEDRRAEEDDVLARLRLGEFISHFETVRIARDGRLIDVSLSVSPVRDRFGRIVGASKVARDISEHRRLDEYR